MNSSILIADDEPNQVELISYNLQKSGFKTILAKNGQEVLDKTYHGIIAQEMQEIAPYMVGEFEMNGTTYFNYNGNALIYMLVNAIQEQQQQIDQLEERLEKLK